MIEADELLIRRFTPKDWRDLYEYLSLESIVKYEPYGIMDQEQCKDIAIYRAASEEFYAVCLKQTDKMIGNLYMAKKVFGTWELGYVFNPEFSGRGYATKSVIALVDYVFMNKNAKKMIANCSSENERSYKLLERIGMQRDIMIKSHVAFKRDGFGAPIWMDTYRYSITKSKWQQRLAEVSVNS